MATVAVGRSWTVTMVARLSAAAVVVNSSRMNKDGRSATGASRRFRGAMRFCLGPGERALGGVVCVSVLGLGLEVIRLGFIHVCACMLSARCRVSFSPPAVHASPPPLFVPALPDLVLLRIWATVVQFAPSILLFI